MFFTSDRDGSVDIYQASRASRAVPFGSPSAVAELNNSSAFDQNPRLPENQRAIYFQSDRNDLWSSYTIFRASRASTSDPFGIPTPHNELNGYSFFDISDDELTIILTSTTYFFVATRTSTSEPFGTPYQLDNSAPNYIMKGSLNPEMNKVYFGAGDNEMYSADFDHTPPSEIPTSSWIVH